MARLGDVFTLIRNGASIKQTDGAKGIPITRIETISDKEINREKFGYADIYDAERYVDFILQDNDILMSHINSEKHLGKTAIYHRLGNEQIIHGMNLLVLRADKSILLPQYANYYFNSSAFLQQIPNITKKSVNQASFTVSALRELSIPIIPISTQQKIVSTLDKLSHIIYLRKQELTKLDELVKARFVEMFGDPAENPLGWMQSTLKEVTLKIGSGATPKGGKEAYQADGITLVRSMNVYDGRFEYKDLAHITDEQAKQLDIVEVFPNDVFINITGASVARSCIVPDDILPARVNQHVSIIRCDPKRLNHFFLNQLFLTSSYKKLLLTLGEAGGATRQAITKQQLEKLSVIVPPMETQNNFSQFATRVEKCRLTIQQGLDKLEVMKKALMQEYFG